MCPSAVPLVAHDRWELSGGDHPPRARLGVTAQHCGPFSSTLSVSPPIPPAGVRGQGRRPYEHETLGESPLLRVLHLLTRSRVHELDEHLPRARLRGGYESPSRPCRPLTLGSLVFEGVTAEPAENASGPGAEADSDSVAEGLQVPAKSHPTRKQLRAFMQLLLRDLVLAAPSPKQWLPLEVLLEVSAGAGLGHGHRQGVGQETGG